MTKTEGKLHREYGHYGDKFCQRPYQNLIDMADDLGNPPNIGEMADALCYSMDADRALPNGDRD